MKRHLLLMPDPAPAAGVPADPPFGGTAAGGGDAPPAPGAEKSEMQSAFEDIDTASGKPPPEAPAKEPAAPAKAAPAKSAAPAKTAAPAKAPAPAKTPAAAPAKAPAAAAKPPEQPEIDPVRASPQQLREAYSRQKTELKTIREENAQLKQRPPAAPDEEGRKRLEADLQSERQRREELENHMRFVDYEKSAEYQEKYHKPYVSTAQDAVTQVMQLRVQQPDGTERAATADDFWAIAHVDNANDALAKAEELFGNATKANFVMQQRERVRQAWMAGISARETFRKEGAERQRRADEDGRRNASQITEKWNALNKQAVEENDWLQPTEGEDDHNALLEKSFEEADAVFGGNITDPQTGQKRPPTHEERLALNSLVRNRAAAFPRIHARLTAALARVAELETAVKQYEESAPGGGEGPGGDAKPAGEGGWDEIDAAFDKAARSP